MRLVLYAVALAGACTGPSLHVDNPGAHGVLVDGVAVTSPVLPFRYYGTTAVDALPAVLPDGQPDWEHRPTRTMVPIPAPAPLWLFPFDFPIELVDRALSGRRDARVVPTVAPVPPLATGELGDAELAAFAHRAHLARTTR